MSRVCGGASVKLRIAQLDHIVLNVRYVDRSLDFYHGVLGLPVERLDEYRAGKIGFPSVRVSGQTIIDLSQRQKDGAAADVVEHKQNHFCLVWEQGGGRA